MQFGQHDIKGSHTPVCGLVCSILPLQHEIHILQVTTECCGNLATRLRVGHLCSTIQLSPCRAGLGEYGLTDNASPFSPTAANFTFEVGPCVGIVEPFKWVLRVTAHPQVLALKLGAPMGACSGQYGSYSYGNLCIHCVTFAKFLQPLPTYMLLGI